MTPIHRLISEAQSAFPEDQIVDVLDACEAFYMNGLADEQVCDVRSAQEGLPACWETTGHFYRVDRFVVETDSLGFHKCHTFDTVAEAEAAIGQIADSEYGDES